MGRAPRTVPHAPRTVPHAPRRASWPCPMRCLVPCSMLSITPRTTPCPVHCATHPTLHHAPHHAPFCALCRAPHCAPRRASCVAPCPPCHAPCHAPHLAPRAVHHTERWGLEEVLRARVPGAVTASSTLLRVLIRPISAFGFLPAPPISAGRRRRQPAMGPRRWLLCAAQGGEIPLPGPPPTPSPSAPFSLAPTNGLHPRLG